MKQHYNYLELFLLSFIILLLIVIIRRLSPSRTNTYKSTKQTGDTCTKDTCGAIDPVNDPAYNMKNIVKQSILLEEHIAEKNKYCLSCIVKHFLHIIGLAEEAVWLAGSSLHKFPFLKESPEFYETTFKTWSANKHDDSNKTNVLNLLRERRRQLIDAYYLA